MQAAAEARREEEDKRLADALKKKELRERNEQKRLQADELARLKAAHDEPLDGLDAVEGGQWQAQERTTPGGHKLKRTESSQHLNELDDFPVSSAGGRWWMW